jgi:hypothetical protein
MIKRTWTTEEKQRYLASTLKYYYKDLEVLAKLKFVGEFQTVIDCNSKYKLGVKLTGSEGQSYYSYVLRLVLYTKENEFAQHSLNLVFDKTKGGFLGELYYGYSTPCFRGKLKEDKTVSFMRDYIEPKELSRLFEEGVHKEELLSAYFEVATLLTDFMNGVQFQVKNPHLNVEGLN